MKRLITICAVVAMVLAVSGTAQALPTVTEYNVHGVGITQWSNATSAVGSSSFEIYTPGQDLMYEAGVEITGFGDIKVKDFDGWSFLTKGPVSYGAQAWAYLDSPDIANRSGYDYDLKLNIRPYQLYTPTPDAPTPDAWVELQSSAPYPTGGILYSGGSVMGFDLSSTPNGTTWSQLQVLEANIWGIVNYDFGEATVAKFAIFAGRASQTNPTSVYLDDFTLNGIPVIVENGFTVVPEPATVAMLGLGALGLIRGRRRQGK